jgi:predicted short-subunit dehydrogenase-like oxidoreductase (DUF2520 family)
VLDIGIVGQGRVGGTLARALRAAGHRVAGPAGRGEAPPGDIVLLCVPDAEIEAAAAAVAGSARFVGHTSGATPLTALEAAGHAAASIASNFLLTLEAAAESVAAGAGIAPPEARRLLGPLVRTTVDNWLALGPERALTGPVARGDEPTIAAQRAGVAEAAPGLLPLFDALLERTRALAGREPAEALA